MNYSSFLKKLSKLNDSEFLKDMTEQNIFTHGYKAPVTINFLKRLGANCTGMQEKIFLWDDYVKANQLICNNPKEQRQDAGLFANFRKNGNAHLKDFLYDTHTADIFVELFSSIGLSLNKNSRILDFGCNSGRFIFTLRDYLEAETFEGCDPNLNAIKDAKEQNGKNIRFFLSDTKPSLEVPSNYYDAIAAFSIWSHYSEEASMSWLKEIQRILKSGGFFVISTQGVMSLARYFLRPNAAALEAWLKLYDSNNSSGSEYIFNALLNKGFLFTTEYEDANSSNDWGQTFMTQGFIKRLCKTVGLDHKATFLQAWGFRQDIHLFSKE